MGRQPVIFVGHGAPTTIIEPEKRAGWEAWGQALVASETERPRGILAISAHWEATPITIGTTTSRPLMRDFGGMPEALETLPYDAPAAPWLAERVEQLVGARNLKSEPERAWDHGVWAPLAALFPQADVPLLQISLPTQQTPREVFALGRTLAPLRDEGVLILGSGNITHNFGALGPDSFPADDFAVEFDVWARDTLLARDFETLVSYREHNRDIFLNHPTEEHLFPLLFAAGASSLAEDPVTFPVEGFEYQNLSRRCVQFG